MKVILNINYKLSKLFSVVTIMLLTQSCESFVEVDLPDSQLTAEVVFNDTATAEAAMANIYSKLVNQTLVCGNTKGISILLGSYADELHTYNTAIGEFQFYQNSLIATHLDIGAMWNNSYNLIYAANAIVESLEQSPISEQEKNRLKGEALFMRAYIHFHLLNLFGEIPYVTTTNYWNNSVIEKLPETDVYSLITADLEEAKELMPSGSAGMNKTRVGGDTVKSFLARVYLFIRQWEKAEIEADAVIHSGNYVWVDALEEVFLKGSTGTIWQLKPTNEGVATLEAQSFVFTMGPPPNRAISENLVDTFEPGDMRKEKWLGSISGESDTWYYPYKYKQHSNEALSSEYSIMIRLEELYLIRAEARLNLGDLEGAKADINKIRNRAELPDVVASTEQELLDAILQERRIELFCELGHRFFDLKRTGKINTVLSAMKPGWNATDVLWPLPESELLLNPNLLPQNNGY